MPTIRNAAVLPAIPVNLQETMFAALANDVLSPTQVRIFATSLEKYMQEMCLPGRGLKCDAGYSHMLPHGGSLYVEAMPRNLRLNFIGPITLVPIEGALPVTTAFGLNFFIDPRSLKSTSNPFGVPAWAIKEIKPKRRPANAGQGKHDDKGEGEETDDTHTSLEVVTWTSSWKYPALKDKGGLVSIQFYSLVPKKWTLTYKGRIELTRPPLPQAVSKIKADAQKEGNPGSAFGDEVVEQLVGTKRKRAGPAGGHNDTRSWKSTKLNKHLFN